MHGYSYSKSDCDNCVYHRRLLDSSFIYLLLCTNDMLIAVKSMSLIKKLKAQLSIEFEMDLGAAKKINFGYGDSQALIYKQIIFVIEKLYEKCALSILVCRKARQ